MKNIDINRLKTEIKRAGSHSRALKLEIRGTPLPWERNLWDDLREIKARATVLCCIRAQMRGRLHLKKCTKSHSPLGLPPMETFTLDDQVKLIGERWKEFEMQEVGEE